MGGREAPMGIKCHLRPLNSEQDQSPTKREADVFQLASPFFSIGLLS